LFFDATETLFDYLDESALLVLDEGALAAADKSWAQTQDRYDQRAHDIERPILPPADLYLSPQDLRECINQRRSAAFVDADHEHALNVGLVEAPDVTLPARADQPAQKLERFLSAFDGRVLITTVSPGRREAVSEL